MHTSIQSIVAGHIRPGRLILWLNGDPDSHLISPQLQRLQRRGLEIMYAKDFGPHTKYFPYVSQFASDGIALVTADDDVIYPKDWLQGLLAAHHREPDLIHCYWARKFTFSDGRVDPYLTWSDVSSREPSARHAALGVAGVLYPSKFLLVLRDAGDIFMEKVPKNDDVWLHVIAVRNGYKISQVKANHAHPTTVPLTQEIGLCHINHLPSGYDAHIHATYSSSDLDLLARHE